MPTTMPSSTALVYFPSAWVILVILLSSLTFISIILFICWARRRFTTVIEKPAKFSFKSTKRTTTPMSLLEVKVELPSIVIFQDEAGVNKFDPFEFAQIPAVRLGDGTLGPLYKVVLNNGLIVAIRKFRPGMAKPQEIDRWIKFFAGVRDPRLLHIMFSFWYGSEAFVIYEYMCLGSLEELLHGREGIQFTSLNWGIRRRIALCVSMAIAAVHAWITEKGEPLVCGVIKASNVLIRTDFSACLSSCETPYLAPSTLIVRRNPGRVAPELARAHAQIAFTQKSDVYSFGILLLELITGKKSIVSDEHGQMKLTKYVKIVRQREGLIAIYDKKMVDINDGVAHMVKIVDLCLVQNPNERPTMERVVEMIRNLQD